MSVHYKRSPIPYMGNKYKLLKQLIPLFPKECDTFVDLFGGSGVVSMNYKGNSKTIYNEINPNIVGMIKMIVENEPQELNKYWQDKINKYELSTMSNKRQDLTDETFFNDRQIKFNRFRDDYNNSQERDYRLTY